MKKIASILVLVLSIGTVGTFGALAVERIAYSAGRSDAAPAQPSTEITRYAFASTPAPTMSPDDPQGDALAIFEFVRSGRGRLAIGPLLVLLVWGLRSKLVLGRFAWFKSTLGGWVLGFGTTALLYAGTTIAAGTAITFNMICDALVTAFAASGKWEALRDAINGMKASVPAGVKSTVLVLITGTAVVLGVGAITIGCATVQKAPGGAVAISCVEQEGDALVTGQAAKIKDACANATDVESCLEGQAESMGITVGGCILANELSKILTTAKGFSGGSGADPEPVRKALAKFHARIAPGVTYQTAAGPL